MPGTVPELGRRLESVRRKRLIRRCGLVAGGRLDLRRPRNCRLKGNIDLDGRVSWRDRG